MLCAPFCHVRATRAHWITRPFVFEKAMFPLLTRPHADEPLRINLPCTNDSCSSAILPSDIHLSTVGHGQIIDRSPTSSNVHPSAHQTRADPFVIKATVHSCNHIERGVTSTNVTLPRRYELHPCHEQIRTHDTLEKDFFRSDHIPGSRCSSTSKSHPTTPLSLTPSNSLSSCRQRKLDLAAPSPPERHHDFASIPLNDGKTYRKTVTQQVNLSLVVIFLSLILG